METNYKKSLVYKLLQFFREHPDATYEDGVEVIKKHEKDLVQGE